MSKRVYQSSKEVILETAKQILLQEGLGNLTTENITTKSGLSKGGFFYHFKTKNDLIDELSLKVLHDMQEAIDQIAVKDPVKKGSTLRAYINFTLSPQNDEMVAVCRSLIEVMFDKNHDSSQYMEFSRELIKRMKAEGNSLENIMSVMLPLDGYWFNDVFGIQMYSKADMRKFIKNLTRFTE